MILPSKELLTETLKHNIDNVKRYTDENNGNCLSYSIDLFDNGSMYNEQIVNIYELMHMMKEWAWKKRYMIDSCYGEPETFATATYLKVCLGNRNLTKEFEADTEPEAVTKACEWILNEITN